MTKKLIGILSVGIALAALLLVMVLILLGLELREMIIWPMRASWWLLLLTPLLLLVRKVWSLPRTAWLMPLSLSLSLFWLTLCMLLWMSLLYKLAEHFGWETVGQMIGVFLVLLSVLLLMGILKVTMFPGSRRFSTRSTSEAEDRVAAALDHIKKGWVAGLISGGITLIIWSLAALGAPALANQFLDVSFVDVILIFGLAYGVYCKSRTCAVIILLQFFATAVYNYKFLAVDVVNFVGLSVGTLIFGYFFGQAVRGTFVYHSLVQRKSSAAAPSKPVSESTSRPV